GKINNLPGMADLLLRNASTLGGKFSAKLVSAISQMDEKEVASHFHHAVQAGLLAIIDNDKEDIHYYFTHDRIHQAAYSLMQDDERKQIHLAAAKYLLERQNSDGSRDPFEIANHLNEADSLLD